MDVTSKAALAAVEALIWQLVTSGTLPAAQLATELERYAGFSGEAGRMLQTLAHVARAGAFPALVAASRQEPARWNRRSKHHA